MQLPFTQEQFLDVMQAYNLAVWPIQLLLYALAIICVVLAYRDDKHKNIIISSILAFLWLWAGIIYHLVFFTSINPAAYGFGALFVLQGIIFLVFAHRKKLSYAIHPDVHGWTGALLVLYALIVYPALNYVLEHWWPQNPTFGLPCPTTIFTFGMLLWTDRPVPKGILIIPLLWSLIGVSAAVNLGIWEDVMLVIAGILATTLIVVRDRRKQGDQTESL